MTRNVLILFPGALGDFLCLLPALLALRRACEGRIAIAAKPSLLTLLPPGFDRLSIDRREVADLFASAPLAAATRTVFSGFTEVHSWTGSDNALFARRLAEVSGATVTLHPFRGMRDGEHAAQYYARCCAVAPQPATLPLDSAALAWAGELWRAQGNPDTLVLHAGSGSPKKNWAGFPELAALWRRRGRVLWVVGPADDAPRATATDVVVRDEPLPQIAALLQHASRYVGNDSGVSHLAAAVGAHGLALFGPTDPIVWRPLGLHLLRAVDGHDPCGAASFCVHRLPVELVLSALLTIPARNA